MEKVISLAIIPGVVATLIAFLSSPLVIKFAWAWGLVDDPRQKKHAKKIHQYPVPRAGGLAIYLSVLLTSIFFLPLDKHLIGILLGSTVLIIIGLADDKWNLNPYLRLALQFAAALIPIAAGIGISFISNPFNGLIDLSQPRIYFELFGETRSIWILADLFALFWIVALMNILNMGAKGVDGQLPGVVAVAAITIALLSLKFSADITQWPVIVLAAITAGAFLGFLPWNIYPQKIMPAFSGSTLAGYYLGLLSILSTAKVGTLAVVLGIPLIDTGYTIVRRILSGKSPVWGDVGHLHHRLLNLGFSKTQVAVFYWLTAAILGTIALHLKTASKLYTIVGIALIIGGGILWLTYHPKKKYH